MKEVIKYKPRDYEFYYIVRDLNSDDPEFIACCVSREEADRVAWGYARSAEPGDTMYIVHMQVVKKIEVHMGEADD